MWSRLFGQLINSMTGTSYDALGSPGFNPDKLSGERLELMKQLAHKAKVRICISWIALPSESDGWKC